MWLLEGTLNQNRGIGKDFRLGLPILSRRKGGVVEPFGQASRINSVHRQSIKDLAPNFRATAFDRAITIEAIEAIDGHRIMGFAVAL